MRLAFASVGCLAAAVLLLAVHGGGDWSRALGVIWTGLFGAAVVFAVAALVLAGISRGVAPKRRLAIVGLSLPALLSVPLLVWAALTLTQLMD
jgi:hypothetical protein